jgi:hypothetical protein
MLALYVSSFAAFHPHYAPPIAATIQKWDLNTLREQVPSSRKKLEPRVCASLLLCLH